MKFIHYNDTILNIRHSKISGMINSKKKSRKNIYASLIKNLEYGSKKKSNKSLKIFNQHDSSICIHKNKYYNYKKMNSIEYKKSRNFIRHKSSTKKLYFGSKTNNPTKKKYVAPNKKSNMNPNEFVYLSKKKIKY